MAEQYGEYRITCSNGSKRNNQESSVRVYKGGVVVARVARPPTGSLLTKIRKWPQSDERKSFVAQLVKNDVPLQVIEQMLAIPEIKLK